MKLPLHGPGARGGLAMVAVLLVLMALFVLCAPFLSTVRNADRASHQLAERASARLAIDSATRHARARLGASHPALDGTPGYDSLEELEVGTEFPEGFLDASDPTGVMWDLEVEDEAGRVDLNSAPPHMIANLAGCVSRLTARLEADEEKGLKVGSTAGFLDQGFVWIGNELVGYAAREGGLAGLVRGLGVEESPEGDALACGPSKATAHELGDFVIDQRAWAVPAWRIAQADGEDLGAFDAIEQAARAVEHAMVGELGDELFAALERTATVHGGVAAGARWMRGVKLMDEVRGQPDEGCVLPVREPRWFNAGTTVRITDGVNVEYGTVLAANREQIRLQEELRIPFEPFETVIQPLARRPVNVNTAPPEVLRALFLNLKLRSASSRITEAEADELVRIVVVSRPFDGLEDFLRRVVLPAAGLEPLPEDAPVVPEVLESLAGSGELREDGSRELVGFLDPDDARALYKNALNANDNELEFSTMPFAFTSRDVYRLDLRASVNAESGVERANRAREEVRLVVPQRDLLRVWARQEDFDEEARLDGEGPFWLSGPHPTGRPERAFGTAWPSRAMAHLGPYDTLLPDPPPPTLLSTASTPVTAATAGAGGRGATSATVEETVGVLTFPSREADFSWLQLAPARADEAGQPRGSFVLHFDDETEHLEGRYLPFEPLALPSQEVRWAGANGLVPLVWRGWIQPREVALGDLYLDVGGNFTDTDSLSLVVEDGALVLRVRDGMGDHPASPFEEVARVRFPLNEGPGLPTDLWTHVEVGASGTRPDQLRMLVDGRWSTEIDGLTRLAASISPSDGTIPVETTEGFPDRCVLRIGDELIEVLKDGNEAFRAVHATTGANAGFGGRLARERFEGVDPELNTGLALKDTAHERGSAVQLYGYSLPIASDVPSLGGTLGDSLGAFAVARVTHAVKNGKESNEMVQGNDPNYPLGVDFGLGLPSKYENLEALQVEPVDGRSIEDTMAAFGNRGGYAALLSKRYTFVTPSGTSISTDIGGGRLGGIEVVQYSGVDGNRVLVRARGDGVRLAHITDSGDEDVQGRGAFVFEWDTGNWDDGQAAAQRLTDQVFLVPISVPVTGASPSSFLATDAPPAHGSEFAQITRLGGESHLTEWIRYDERVGDYLVRDHPDALHAANLAAHGGRNDSKGDVTPDRGSPGNPTGVGGGSNRLAGPPAAAASTRTTRTSQSGDGYWHYGLGEPEVEVEDLPLTRAVASQFQFRGVLGTYSHAHPAGTPVLPVWKVFDQDETAGRPGRWDHVALASGEPDEPVFPAVVQHAHLPWKYQVHSYADGGPFAAVPAGSDSVTQGGFDANLIHVALQEALPVPFPSSAIQGQVIDTRDLARVMAFPSGELPRGLSTVAVGGAHGSPTGSAGGVARTGGANVPSAVVDELVFGAAPRPQQLVVAGGNPGGPEVPFSDGDQDLAVREVVRTLGGDHKDPAPLTGLHQEGGLLRIGDEILCYDGLDVGSSTFHVPPEGRGLLGTDAQTHAPGESIQVLESWRATVLVGTLGADDHRLPVASTQDFPAQGTVLVGEELLHYTHLEGGAFAMPRASKEPGERDGQGGGLFRGRYGTEPASHPPGTPVILFPFRYWDRWAPRADDPELAYFRFDLDQPGAWHRRVFWDDETPAVGGSRLGVLQRLDPSVPWDADPDREEALELLDAGLLDQGGNRIGAQADRAEWRVFVRYDAGAFDPVTGLSHGWKTTPKLRLFGAESLGPGRVLRRVDR